MRRHRHRHQAPMAGQRVRWHCGRARVHWQPYQAGAAPALEVLRAVPGAGAGAGAAGAAAAAAADAVAAGWAASMQAAARQGLGRCFWRDLHTCAHAPPACLPACADNSASLAEALRSVMASRAGQDNFQLIIITHDEKFARLIGTHVSGCMHARVHMHAHACVHERKHTHVHMCRRIHPSDMQRAPTLAAPPHTRACMHAALWPVGLAMSLTDQS